MQDLGAVVRANTGHTLLKHCLLQPGQHRRVTRGRGAAGTGSGGSTPTSTLWSPSWASRPSLTGQSPNSLVRPGWRSPRPCCTASRACRRPSARRAPSRPPVLSLGSHRATRSVLQPQHTSCITIDARQPRACSGLTSPYPGEHQSPVQSRSRAWQAAPQAAGHAPIGRCRQLPGRCAQTACCRSAHGARVHHGAQERNLTLTSMRRLL